MHASFPLVARALPLITFLCSAGCTICPIYVESDPSAPPAQARSLTGAILRARPPGDDPKQEQLLADATRERDAAPHDVEKQIWVGRRLGYLWRMNEAIAVFRDAIEEHPSDARLYRHRGHRRISLRQFELAIDDLKQAAALIAGVPDQIEPDGLPNARNTPLTTTAFNVWYHLALAQYLRGDYEAALQAWAAAGPAGRGLDDNTVAVAYWTYLTLRKLGRSEQATELLKPISPSMNIVENGAYHQLLLHFRRERTAEQLLADVPSERGDYPTLAYGIACQELLDGRRAAGIARLRSIIKTRNWPAFGFIAAEAELARDRHDE